MLVKCRLAITFTVCKEAVRSMARGDRRPHGPEKCCTFAPSSLSSLLPPPSLAAADTDDSKRPKNPQSCRRLCHSRSLDSILQFSRFASRVSDSVTSLGAGCRRYQTTATSRCRVLVALACLPQVQRCTGRPYLQATSTLAACARKTCHSPHVTVKRLQPPFQ